MYPVSPIPEPDPPSPASDAPPTEQGEFSSPRRSAAWPTSVGVISIVCGSLGILANLWGAISPYFMHSFTASLGPSSTPSMRAMLQAQRDTAGWTVSAGLLNTIAAILLLICGIGINGRSAWSVPLSRTWAVLKIIFAVFGIVAGIIVQRAVITAMSGSQPAGGSGAFPTALGGVFALFGVFVGLVVPCGYPIFMLIWFSRLKVREEVSRW